MRSAIERWLMARWYGGRPPGPVLMSLAWIYAVILGIRERFYQRGWSRVERLPVPVIVVGNRVAGGAGKTPVVIALVQYLQSRGERVGVLSRGYGRSSRQPHRVAASSLATESGDEPLEIFVATGALVQVDSDRIRAGQMLVAEGCTVLVADDGMQHRRLGRDLEIEVIDGQRGYGNGRLMPAGPLREPMGDHPNRWRLISGEGSAHLAGWRVLPQLGNAQRLDLPTEQQPLDRFMALPVAALAGIARPTKFFDALASAGLRVEAHPFPDHHAFEPKDLVPIRTRPLLVTAKDAVKLAAFDLQDVWMVPLHVTLPAPLLATIDQRLAECRHDLA